MPSNALEWVLLAQVRRDEAFDGRGDEEERQDDEDERADDVAAHAVLADAMLAAQTVVAAHAREEERDTGIRRGKR